MIVNYTANGWQIIMQRAHGLLAAQIAMHWRKKDRPERWTETILAIAEHDDAQTELEADDLLTPQGGPVNYAMKMFDSAHCKRLHDFSLSKSRYIGLLTSMHMCFLHHTEAETNPAAKLFLEEQVRLQDGLRKELKLSKKNADHAYGILEWCDALSLLLCRGEIQPGGRIIEVSNGPDNKTYKLKQKKNGSLSVKPWPFDVAAFQLYVERRVIDQLHFTGNSEFKAALIKAPVEEKIWRLEK